MRGAALTVTLLLLLAPLGLAQESGSESGSGSASPSPSPSSPPPGGPCDGLSGEARDKCLREQARCRERPDDVRCRPAGNQSGNQSRPEGKPERAPEGCSDGNASAEQHCRAAVRQIAEERGRDWVSFTVDAANATLDDYTISGLLALDAVHLGLDGGNLSIEPQGNTLRVLDGDGELRLHDEPNGLIRFKGGAGNVTLDFPAGATITRAEHGARIAYAGGREGHLLAEEATWLDGDSVRLDGFFRFHVPPEGAAARDDGDERPAAATEADERKERAIEDRRVGAEVHLKARPPQAAATSAAHNESIQVLAYDDVDVEVELPAEQAAPDAPVRVVVSSELDEGRTIVLNLDAELLASTDADDLLLRYFDLHNQTDGTVLETEVLFHQAASLADVLEPTDDGGQPEFWVVEDANGVQVLVSVPHWSAHAITVASIAKSLDAPSVLVGVSIGAFATIGLGMALLWPRRRDDEL